MYIAALRIADDFGCDTIGIQYQQGLKDLAPASDLAEGLLNNVDRPPVTRARQWPRAVRRPRAAALQRSGRVRRPGCAGDQSRLDANWASIRRPRCTTCATASRIGERPRSSSGCSRSRAPRRRQHLIGGYAGAVSERQPPMYFRLGGGSLKGVSKPGEIVWSRDLRRRRQAEGGHRPRQA